MSTFTMTIDGKAVAAENTFGVINPATEEVFAECPDCTQAQLDAAMESAKRAFPEWRQDEARRRQILRDCAEVMKRHAEELAELQTREQGKPLKNSVGEIQYSAWWFDQTATLELPCDILQDDEKVRIEVRRHPLGVVGAITPWNFPIAMAVWKIAPALLAGNTIVLKPSPYTPLSTLKLGEILRDVVPAGVLNVVSGGDELGAWITKHPTVRKISFTGSVETGKQIAHVTAPDLKRIVLELGGNDAAIVLPDVDPKSVAPKIFWEAFGNCGQVCVAIKRLYVHQAVFQPLLQELAEIARNVKVGDGFEPETEIGPLNNKAQLERVIELVEDARQAGGQIVTGGQRLERPGYFYAPTLVTDIAEGVRLVDEEQFGPALPVLSFSSVDEALERANATHYGLGGSIWTNDLERGTELASQLECGISRVNKPDAPPSPFAPFGGAKWSGIGCQNGVYGLEAFTQLQTIEIART